MNNNSKRKSQRLNPNRVFKKDAKGKFVATCESVIHYSSTSTNKSNQLINLKTNKNV